MSENPPKTSFEKLPHSSELREVWGYFDHFMECYVFHRDDGEPAIIKRRTDGEIEYSLQYLHGKLRSPSSNTPTIIKNENLATSIHLYLNLGKIKRINRHIGNGTYYSSSNT